MIDIRHLLIGQKFRTIKVRYKIDLANLNLYLNRINGINVSICTEKYNIILTNHDVQDFRFGRKSIQNSIFDKNIKHEEIDIFVDGICINKLNSYINLFNNKVTYMKNEPIIRRNDIVIDERF